MERVLLLFVKQQQKVVVWSEQGDASTCTRQDKFYLNFGHDPSILQYSNLSGWKIFGNSKKDVFIELKVLSLM